MRSGEQADHAGARDGWLRLPEFEPDPMLWSRIVAARVQQSRTTRRRRAGWIGAALAATLAAFVVLPRLGDVLPVRDEVRQWQQRSQTLEHEWRASARAPGDPRARAELNLIDDALQAAYDRGAASSELAPLWKQRSEALHSLISNGQQRAAVTRI